MQVTCAMCQPYEPGARSSPRRVKTQFVCARVRPSTRPFLVDGSGRIGAASFDPHPERDANISPRREVQTATLVDAIGRRAHSLAD